jgi:hypothetical protein
LLTSLNFQPNQLDTNAVNSFRAPNAVGNVAEGEPEANDLGPLEPLDNEPQIADVVELSDESLQLARLENNEGIGGTVEQEITAAAANNLDTGNQLPTDETGAIQENLNNPAAPEATNLAQNPVTDVNAPATLTTEEPLTVRPIEAVSQGPGGGTEAVETPTQNAANTSGAPEAATTGTAATPAAGGAEGGTAGTVSGNENTEEIETETGAGEEELNLEAPAPPEGTENPGTNAVLNSANGTTPAAPADVTEIEPQTPRSEEQVLLQNVGTQLAQVVPPANIISVLG